MRTQTIVLKKIDLNQSQIDSPLVIRKLAQLLSVMDTSKCNTCQKDAPEYCGVCRPPIPPVAERKCCGSGGACEGEAIQEFCETCYTNLRNELRQLGERATTLTKEQEERNSRMEETKREMEEMIAEVKEMRRSLASRDEETASLKWKVCNSERTIDEYCCLLREKDRIIKDLEQRRGDDRQKPRDDRQKPRDDRQKPRDDRSPPKREKELGDLEWKLGESEKSVYELTGVLNDRDRYIEGLESRLRAMSLFPPEAVKSLQEALCETVRNEMQSHQPRCDAIPGLPRPDLRTLDTTFFFDMMQPPQTTWEDRESETKPSIVVVEEEEKGGGEREKKEEEDDEDLDLIGFEEKTAHSVLNEKEEPSEEDKHAAEDVQSSGPLFTLSDYKKGLLLVGDTKSHTEKLKDLKGKWVPSLHGWVFSPKRREAVEAFIETAKAKIAEKEASDKRKEARKAKRVSKLKYNEEMEVYVDSSYEILFHPQTKEAFAHMDDSEDIDPLSKFQIDNLEKKGYTVMAKRERKKFLSEYLEKAKPLTEKLVEHPKLEGYFILESYPYLFTCDKVAFCALEAEECSPLSKDGLSWLVENDFEVLSKRDRRKEIIKVQEFLEDFNDSDSSSESDVDLSDSDSD